MSNIFNISTPSEKVLLLDSDSLVYRVGDAIDMQNLRRHDAERLLANTIERYYEDTGCSKCEIYLGTDNSNYRLEIATMLKYKGNRDGSRRPTFYKAIRRWLINNYGAVLIENQEAEDEVGIKAYSYDEYSKFIVGAIDKDMLMIAGNHYNYGTGKQQFVSKIDAMRWFYTQLVTGDKSVDNIPGLYHLLLHFGEDEKAHKFRYSRYKSKLIKVLAEMTTEKGMWEHVFDIYNDQIDIDKRVMDAIIEIGRLLWIRRYENELWVPPNLRDFDYITNDKRIEL